MKGFFEVAPSRCGCYNVCVVYICLSKPIVFITQKDRCIRVFVEIAPVGVKIAQADFIRFTDMGGDIGEQIGQIAYLCRCIVGLGVDVDQYEFIHATFDSKMSDKVFSLKQIDS